MPEQLFFGQYYMVDVFHLLCRMVSHLRFRLQSGLGVIAIIIHRPASNNGIKINCYFLLLMFSYFCFTKTK
jgi:hypothetical protein